VNILSFIHDHTSSAGRYQAYGTANNLCATSTIKDKAKLETLNEEALQWFARTISTYLSTAESSSDGDSNGNGTSSNGNAHVNVNDDSSVIIVHGAGSFGHHSAKEYGLRGRDCPPPNNITPFTKMEQRKLITGLAKTRHSVKKLNSAVVSHLIDEGINAVGISPCMNIPGLMAHGGNEQGGVTILAQAIQEALMAGLVPVIHGDAGLYGNNFETGMMAAGILGGDTLVEIIATHELLRDYITRTVFLTDVEGVYTKDPKSDSDATLIRLVEIDPTTGKVMTDLSASGSSHEHDVTGGLATKLGAAANVAKTGIEVIIAKCCSLSAEQAINGKTMDEGTVIKRVERK